MIPIKDNYKFGADPTMEDQIRRTNNRIYKTKNSILDRPSQRIEALSLYGSRWALSEDSGFKSYPSRPKTWCDRQQLWMAVITGDTVTILSIPIRGRGKSPEEGQRWNLAETQWKKKQHENYQDEGKKSAINKN